MGKAKNKKSRGKSKKFNKLQLIPVIVVLLLACATAAFLYDYIREKEYILTTIVDGEIVDVTVTIAKGRVVSPLTDPVLEGHTFEGWYLDEAFTQPFVTDQTKIKGVSNIYAKMMIIKYTETFISNGGSDVAPINYEYGTSPIEPNTPVLYNNLFTGWYLDEAKTERYAFDTIPNADITLYAGWVTIQSALNYSQFGSSMMITGYKAGIPEHFILPTTIDGFNVTYVGIDAFKNCTKLIEVTIPSNNTNIADSIFNGCNNISKMSIPLRENHYNNLTFYFGANIPASLKTLTINEGAIKIEAGFFSNSVNLVTVNLPDTITIIDESAFSNCNNLVNINMPANLIKIGASAFNNCFKLPSITIPSGVTYIGVGTFASCVQLTKVTLPETLTRIENSAFYGCITLADINLPNSIERIDEFAFFQCKLTNVTIPTSMTQLKDGIFNGCASLESVTLHDGITSMGSGVFYSCVQLTSINLPDSITSIGNYAFYGCSRLNNVVMPAGMLEIGQFLFANCTLLSNITLPLNLQKINEGAFSYCSSLRNINIPNTLTHLGTNAFSYCTILETVTFNSTTPPVIGSNVFGNVINFAIKVPSASVNAYKTASGWSSYSSKIVAI